MKTNLKTDDGHDAASPVCDGCRGRLPSLSGAALAGSAAGLPPGWRVIGEHHLEREYRFPDFRSALEWVNRIGALAEEQGHHPDLELSWGRVGVRLLTHTVDGLTESDFLFVDGMERLSPAKPEFR